MCDRVVSLFRAIGWLSTALFLLCTRIFGILIYFQPWTSQRLILALSLHSPRTIKQTLLSLVRIAAITAIHTHQEIPTPGPHAVYL